MNMKFIKNNIFLFSNVPVLVIYLALFLLRLPDDSGSLALLEMFITTFIIPISLLFFNYSYNIKKNKFTFISNSLSICFAVALANALSYTSWGVSTGGFYNPDSETVLISNLMLQISAGITLVGCILIQVLLIVKWKKKN
jgi:hypothetical protein